MDKVTEDKPLPGLLTSRMLCVFLLTPPRSAPWTKKWKISKGMAYL